MNRNAIIAIIIILSCLFIGYFALTQYVLPSLTNKIVSTSLNTVAGDMNFDNAKSVAISQDLSKNEGMVLSMIINKGDIVIDGKSVSDTLSGEVKYMGSKPIVSYSTDENKAALFTIKSTGQDGENPILHLSQKTDDRIDISLGAGSVVADLTDVYVPILNVSAGAGTVDITFSNKASTTANISSGVGTFNALVHKGTGVKLSFGQGLGANNMNLGDTYVKTTNGYETKNYSSAQVKLDLNIGQGLGGFNITEIQ